MEHLLNNFIFAQKLLDILLLLMNGKSGSSTLCINCHSISKILSNTDIIDNQSSWFILVYTIYSCNSLH